MKRNTTILAELIVCLAVLAAGTATLAWVSIIKHPVVGVASQKTSARPQQNTASGPETATAGSVTDLRQQVAEIVAIVDQQNPRAALKELASRMKADPVVFKNCHAIAHEIGHEAYKKYNDFVAALKQQDSICADGYLHGVLEQRLFDAPNEKNVLEDMKTLCAGAGFAASRCYHGIGHGLMFYFENDLPKALGACATFAGSMRGRCDEGVFMQNFLSDPDQPLTVHPSKYLDPSNPFFPCTTEPRGLKAYCYFYAPIFFLGQHDNNYVAALKWCETAEKAGVIACVRGVGSLAMKYSIEDPKYAESICDQARPDLISYCIDGLVSYHLTFSFSVNKTEAMCDQLENKNQVACNWALQRRSDTPVD